MGQSMTFCRIKLKTYCLYLKSNFTPVILILSLMYQDTNWREVTELELHGGGLCSLWPSFAKTERPWMHWPFEVNVNKSVVFLTYLSPASDELFDTDWTDAWLIITASLGIWIMTCSLIPKAKFWQISWNILVLWTLLKTYLLQVKLYTIFIRCNSNKLKKSLHENSKFCHWC